MARLSVAVTYYYIQDLSYKCDQKTVAPWVSMGHKFFSQHSLASTP